MKYSILHRLGHLLLLPMCATWAIAIGQQVAPSRVARPQGVAPTGDGPRIEFVETTHKFDRVSAGAVIKHNFEFKNTGTKPLQIKSVQPSCGCTPAGDWSKMIAPGQTGAIPVQLSTTNFKGPIHKTITVTSTALNQPLTTLHLQGEVWVPVAVTPSYVYFSLVAGRSQTSTRSLKIKNNTEKPLEIREVEATPEALATELKTITPGKEFELVVSIAGELPSKSNQGMLKLKTNWEDTPSIDVKVYAHVQNPIVATPTHLILPAGPLKTAVKRYVTIRSNEKEPLKVEPPAFDGLDQADAIKLTMTETLKGKMFRIEVLFPAGFQLPKGKSAVLNVATSHPDFSEFKLPIIQPQAASRVSTAPAFNRKTVRPVTVSAKPKASPDFSSPVPSLAPVPPPPKPRDPQQD